MVDLKIDTEEVDGSSPFGPTMTCQSLTRAGRSSSGRLVAYYALFDNCESVQQSAEFIWHLQLCVLTF
jgi:hypothetical protein